SPTSTSRASSANSLRRLARPASILPPSTSGAMHPVGTRWRSSRSMASYRMQYWPKCEHYLKSSRPSHCVSKIARKINTLSLLVASNSGGPLASLDGGHPLCEGGPGRWLPVPRVRALAREGILMANVVVVGSQWGDEGKGKIVDWLSEQADIVVRFQ